MYCRKIIVSLELKKIDKLRKDRGGIKIPKQIIFLIKLLEKVNSYVCMRFVSYIWTKPLRYKIPDREIPITNSSNFSMVKINEINKIVKCYRWIGKGPKILVVHGWSARASNMFYIIQELIYQGYDVYSFDAPAHGDSPSKTTSIPEFIACIKQLSNSVNSMYAIIGHSGGGFAAIYYTAMYDRNLEKLVIISPFNSVYELFQNFFKLIKIGNKVGHLLIDFFNKKTGIKIDQNLTAHKLIKLINSNVLLIHDENDSEIPISDSRKIKKNIKRGEVFFTKELGHRRILRAKSVKNKIINFLVSHKESQSV
tara:strand:+ start:345 stop:1274 length:930 start_codon:yes stop_codon:yes gene_type:complete